MTDLVFVYGTLKRGYRNNYLLEKSEYLDTGLTAKRFKMITVGFPVVLMHEQVARVTGEVYRVDSETMRRMDSLESNGHMYLRRKVLVLLTNGGCVSCWMYIGVHKFWRDRIPYVRHMEPVNGQYTWPGGLELMSMQEILDLLKNQANGRSLENDEAGVLDEARDSIIKGMAEIAGIEKEKESNILEEWERENHGTCD